MTGKELVIEVLVTGEELVIEVLGTGEELVIEVIVTVRVGLQQSSLPFPRLPKSCQNSALIE